MSHSAVILCNGAFPRTAYPLYLLENASVVVCCDGAFRKWLKHFGDRLPDAVVGDMDSLPKFIQKRFLTLLVKVDEQDYNDLTKSVRLVLERWPEMTEIHILGATGMREDHTVGNLGLLMEYQRMFDLGGRKMDMVSDYGTAFAVTDSCELHVGAGRRVSLFSADPTLRVISKGLHWPLADVVFDAWWKATLNRADEDIISLEFSHPSCLLVMLD